MMPEMDGRTFQAVKRSRELRHVPIFTIHATDQTATMAPGPTTS